MTEDLGRRIRTLRKKKGLTQEMLAPRAGVTLNSIVRIELGRTVDPHLSTLRGICNALDVSVGEILGERE